ncbi:MAG: hypothetical protein OXC83_02710 [Chloroflexi bacterium]|nr:hypothetical protein [Chloroflexota bacterium]
MNEWIDVARTEQHAEELSLHTIWHECQHPDWQINPHLRREISTRTPVSKDTTVRIKHADYFGDHYENAVVVPAGDTCSVEITDPSASQSVHEEVIETTTRRIDTTTGEATSSASILHIIVDIPIGITAVLQVLDS